MYPNFSPIESSNIISPESGQTRVVRFSFEGPFGGKVTFHGTLMNVLLSQDLKNGTLTGLTRQFGKTFIPHAHVFLFPCGV